MFVNLYILQTAKSYMYDDIQQIPQNNVGLVLGTAKTINGKFENLFFTYRINAAAQLFFAGKVKHLLVSGDNSTQKYNEPLDMKKALMSLGVPDSCITMDFGGRRTFDSVIRSSKIFNQQSFTIISQEFHNPRAIYIARANGLNVVAFNATMPHTDLGWTKQREWFARFKALLDINFLGTKPKFLGEPVEIEVRP
jgi:SanA protein